MDAETRNDRNYEKVKAAVTAGEMSVGEALKKFNLTSPAYYTRKNKESGKPKGKRGAKPKKEAVKNVTITRVEGGGTVATGKTLIIVTNDVETIEKAISGFMRGEA